jgi:hypothetical protein
MRPFALAILLPCLAVAGQVTLERDEAKHTLTIAIDGKTAVVYNHDPGHFLPYYCPVNSPSGKELTVRLTKPYPHHRSFWFTDKVQREGLPVSDFYNAHYKYKDGKGAHIRHDKFLVAEAKGDKARVKARIVWQIDLDKPVLEENRDMALLALKEGEYFLDIRFVVTAAFGDVTWRSDDVHYAWPYIRMHPQFSVQKGGSLVNSAGGVNQKGTHNKVATWCDYVNTIDGATEGLAFYSHPENDDHPHRWLTRDYGTLGPRRKNAQSGKPFILKKGESLARRIGVLVHKGDVKAAKVAERYEEYSKGKLNLLEEKK